MIQIVFTDNGKVHTVTFSGDDANHWSKLFGITLVKNNIDYELRKI